MLYYTLGTFNLYCFEQSMAVPRKKTETNISACLTYCKSLNICLQEQPLAMTQTRQNSKKSTGGHAPHSRWTSSLPVKAKASSPHSNPDHKHPDKSGNNNVGSLPHYQCGFP